MGVWTEPRISLFHLNMSVCYTQTLMVMLLASSFLDFRHPPPYLIYCVFVSTAEEEVMMHFVFPVCLEETGEEELDEEPAQRRWI